MVAVVEVVLEVLGVVQIFSDIFEDFGDFGGGGRRSSRRNNNRGSDEDTIYQ